MKVLVLMGGLSGEREISLRTGQGVVGALERLGHAVRAIDTGTGQRLLTEATGARRLEAAEAGGAARSRPPRAVADLPTLPALVADRSLDVVRDAAEGIDVVFIALHGGAGEDGTIQALLETVGAPYTGSGVLASALAMNKEKSKRIFRDAGIPTPRGVFVTTDGASVPREVRDFPARVGWPVVVKPNDQGSTIGVTIVHDPRELAAGVAAAARVSHDVLVEEFIPGRELTVAVLGGEALPVVEIIPESGFYDYEAKYSKGRSQYRVPADLPEPQAMRVRELGAAAFRVLDCRGVARVDFRLHTDGTPYCLEVNTVPGLTELSLVPMAARAAGVEYDELVDRILRLAVRDGAA
jgi:D-alanine-D-alanine ligase